MLKFSKSKIGKRAFSAFLCAVLSFSNVQAVAYAGEAVGEEFSTGGEDSSEQESKVQEASAGQGSSLEAGSFGGEIPEESKMTEGSLKEETGVEQNSEESNAEEKEKQAQDAQSADSEAQDKTVEDKENTEEGKKTEGASEEASSTESALNEAIEEGEKKELSFLEPGVFQESSPEGVQVTAKYGEDTFPEGTFMRLSPVEDEEILSTMKDKVKAEKEKKAGKGEEVEIRSAYFVDISFYRLNDEGKEVEVQPKNGKSVEISFRKNNALEEALSIQPGVWAEEYVEEEEMKKEKSFFKKDAYSISLPESEELTVVHLPEGRNAELLPLKDGKDSFSFKGRHFSPHGVVSSGTGPAEAEQKNHVFVGYWKEVVDPKTRIVDPDLGHSYPGSTEDDVRSKKNLLIVPSPKKSNGLNPIALSVDFTLKGNKDTVYPPGTVTMEVPTRIYESWNANYPDRVAYRDNASEEYSSVQSPIPAAPGKNTVTDFNYTLVEKEIDGKKIPYFHMVNHTSLPAGVTFSADFVYYMVPSMIKVKHRQVGTNNEEVGEYNNAIPVFAEVNHPNDIYDAQAKDDLSLTLRTKVNPLAMKIAHGTSGVNGGIFYNWDDAWGPKPANADDYFYVSWFVDVERPQGSSQAFDYSFRLPQTTGDGGELVGAQKANQGYTWNDYTFASNLKYFTQTGIYKDIAKYMNSTPPITPITEYSKVNPINRSFIGIDKEPIKTTESVSNDTTRERGGNTEYNRYSYSSTANAQRYVALYRYPMSKITDAINAPGRDPKKPLLVLKNSVEWTETWADTYVRRGSAETDEAGKAKIVLPVKQTAVINLDKDNGKYIRNVGALQSLIADGISDVNMDGLGRNNTFYMSAGFHADGNQIQFNTDGSYTVPESKAVLRDDGEYYLYTLKSNSVSEGINSDWSTPLNTEVSFKEPGTPVYKLKEEDFYYDTVSISSMEIFDVKKANPPINYTPSGEVRSDFSSYKPIELWIRKRGSNQYEKFGSFQAVEKNKFNFTPEAGFNVHTANNNSQAITDSNYIDLEKSISEKIAGIEFRIGSNSYQTNIKTKFGIKLTPGEEMRKNFQDALKIGDNGKYNFIGGPGYGKYSTGSGSEFEKRLGSTWMYVGYRYDPISLRSKVYKTVDNVEDNMADSEQLVKSMITISNESTIAQEYQEDKYVSPYLLREGVIYDLLPAGTYVNPKEIALGPTYSKGKAIDDFQQGIDYIVEMIPNWENSGQTMMKISFKTPKGSKTLSWKPQGRSYLRLYYVIHNPYINIIDRGTVHQNTVAFVNTSKETKWNPNFNLEDKEKKIVAQKTGKIKEPYFQNIMEEAWNSDESHYKTMYLEDAPVYFKPLRAVQATLTNEVSTELHGPYRKENVSYMGDPYKHRIKFQSQSITRTTDLVMYDILGDSKDRNGDFAGVDISSMLGKQSYKYGLTTENTDTLEPEVYYATVIPTAEQRDLGVAKYDKTAYENDNNPNNPKNQGSIWKKWDVKNPKNNEKIDRSQIKAIAIDARTTKAGERFILDKEGMLAAYVEMTATTDMNKVSVKNTNTAFRTARIFAGAEPTESDVFDTVEAPSFHSIIEPVILSIPVKKQTVTPQGLSVPNIRNAFKFTLKGGLGASLLDEKGQAIVTEKTNPDADGGLMEFGKIRILRPGTYVYTVTESGNRPGIQNDLLSEKTVTVTVNNEDDQKLTYTSTASAETPLVFTNTYGVEKVEPNIKVKKILESYGGISVPDISGKFSFTLKAVNGAPMPEEAAGADSLTKTNPNPDGGEISFGKIGYTLPGDYQYVVTEAGTVPSVKNDESETKHITVQVRDLGDGTMSATVSGDGLEFRNVLPLAPIESKLSLRKEIQGQSNASKEKKDIFSFTLRWVESELAQGGNAGVKLPTNLAPMPGNKMERSTQITVEGEGQAEFEPISFPAPGKYSYELTEDRLSLGGYKFDPSRYQVVFTVDEDPEEPLKLRVKKEIFKDDVSTEEVVFVNEVIKPGQPSIPPVTPKPFVPTTPIPLNPVGGPGEKPSLPEPPAPPLDIPEQPGEPGDPENNPPSSITPVRPPRTREEVEKRIGEILGKNRPLTPEEEEELKKLGEVLSKIREKESRATKTGDSSTMSLYALFAGLSAILLGLYMSLKRRFSK